MMRATLLALMLVTTAGPAACEESYLDDRSGPAAMVKSLYNAINRREFARAYSYFSKAPGPDVETYAKGYEKTERVEVMTGAPSEEGVAGSIVYRLPVAIRATDTDGSESVFAGCYTLRMANPAVQAGIFEPLQIERGALRVSTVELKDAVPTSCGDGPALPVWDAALESAKEKFAASAPENCIVARDDMAPEELEPTVYPIGFRHDYESESDPERVVKLIRFFCFRGAYNEAHIYYLADEYGEVSPLQFAEPELDIRYVDDDFEKAVEEIRIVGFKAQSELINSDYDPETRTISEFSKWRGIGDASSAAVWAFRQGSFSLVKYEVDAHYDGEIELETIVDYDTAP